MRFAICNETFQDWPFEKAFAFARELGYTGIEYAPFTMTGNGPVDVRRVSAEQRKTIRNQAEAAGLEAVGLHWLLAKTEGFYLTTPDAAVRKRTSEYIGELARMCRDLGGSVMVFGSPKQRDLLPGVSLEQATDLAVDCLKNSLSELEKHNVTIALEPLSPADTNFMNTADSAVELADKVNHPLIQIQLDVKAMCSEPTPIPEIIRKHITRTAHFHANDANLQGPGMGDVDFAPIFQALRDSYYTGWVSVEVFDYAPGIEALASKSIAYMKETWANLNRTDEQSLNDIEFLLKSFPGVTAVRITRDKEKDEIYIAYRCSSLDSIKDLVMCTTAANVPLRTGDPRFQFDGQESDDLPFYVDIDSDSVGYPQTQTQIFGIFLARTAGAKGFVSRDDAERLEARLQRVRNQPNGTS